MNGTSLTAVLALFVVPVDDAALTELLVGGTLVSTGMELRGWILAWNPSPCSGFFGLYVLVCCSGYGRCRVAWASDAAAHQDHRHSTFRHTVHGGSDLGQLFTYPAPHGTAAALPATFTSKRFLPHITFLYLFLGRSPCLPACAVSGLFPPSLTLHTFLRPRTHTHCCRCVNSSAFFLAHSARLPSPHPFLPRAFHLSCGLPPLPASH